MTVNETIQNHPQKCPWTGYKNGTFFRAREHPEDEMLYLFCWNDIRINGFKDIADWEITEEDVKV